MKLEERIGELLKSKNLSLSTAESCTGGSIAALVTSVPGSSEYFNGGIVAYSNEVKMSLLHVSAETLEKYGAVSRGDCYRDGERCDESVENRLRCRYIRNCRSRRGQRKSPSERYGLLLPIKNEIVTFRQEGDDGRGGNVQKAIQNALMMLCECLK